VFVVFIGPSVWPGSGCSVPVAIEAVFSACSPTSGIADGFGYDPASGATEVLN